MKEIEIEGMEELIKNLEKIGKQNKETCQKILLNIGNDLLNKSRQIVPIKTGMLAQDSTAGLISEDEVVVTYGLGMARDYAVVQHERVEFRHPNGREAKYLEKPFRENIPNYTKKIEEKLKEMLK